jgi:hypothetical protein
MIKSNTHPKMDREDFLEYFNPIKKNMPSCGYIYIFIYILCGKKEIQTTMSFVRN